MASCATTRGCPVFASASSSRRSGTPEGRPSSTRNCAVYSLPKPALVPRRKQVVVP
jgi:hypothetical protein